MKRTDFSYYLPPELIAQHPLSQRRDSRLLCLSSQSGACSDRRFSDLPGLLHPDDLLIFNDTRVIKARLYGRKETGGSLEVLVERLVDVNAVLAHVRSSKSPKPGSRIRLGDSKQEVLVECRVGSLFRLRCTSPDGFPGLMRRHGHMPLPPYINRADAAEDEARYQTVFARNDGAVAAPTAGLHFDREMLQQLTELGVRQAHITLHVGAGTFQPVRAERLEDHEMHSEYLELDETVCEQVRETRRRGGRVVAVGTTSVRSLESAAAAGELRPYSGDTRLFISPGYRFRVVDALITNFHLPESTLLMLVCALSGYQPVMAAYRHAVEKGYRFFSYGDAMFLQKERKQEQK